jgi:hypothetical protein
MIAPGIISKCKANLQHQVETQDCISHICLGTQHHKDLSSGAAFKV